MTMTPTPTPAAPKRFRRLWIIAALIVVALIGARFLTSGKAEDERNDKSRPVSVIAAPVVVKSMPVEITAIGHIEPIASVTVKPRIDGEITRVAVNDGQDVQAGDLLFTLDDRQAQAALAQAKATLIKDKAQLAFAQSEAVRFKKLMEATAGSREQMEQAEANAEALKGTVAADEAQIDNDATELSYTQITAPISGRIGTINFKEGNIVQAQSTNNTLAVINQLAPIYVSFSVPELNVASLQQAMERGPVRVTVSTQGADTASDVGEITYIDNAIDTSTATLVARATLPNAKEYLWPGQFVNVVIVLRNEPNALVVASQAVQPGQDGTFVFVVKNDATVEMRPVTVDRVVGTETVIAKGLKAGEQVVTTGQLRLTPGARVLLQGNAPTGGKRKAPGS
ncbi:MAG: efflux RND transporter periplasmic adaptor subunit [Alphaproteobacteria bacterium]